MTDLNLQKIWRQSLLQTVHQELGAQWGLWQEQRIVEHYSCGVETELQCAEVLGLCDLSPLSRCGFKGRDVPAWLREIDIRVPEQPNTAVVDDIHGLVARLSVEEHLFLNSPFSHNSASSLYFNEASTTQRVYSLPRQASHAWLYVCGANASKMMSHVCAVDLSTDAFADLQVAQTSVARVNGIVIRQDVEERVGYHLLCDQPSVEYWWHALIDAAKPLGGSPVGLRALTEHSGNW